MQKAASKKRQTEKKTGGEFQLSPEAEAAVREVHEGLQRTLAYFMANVGALTRTFDAKLQEALPHNPKARFFEDEKSPPSSPLLKRPPRPENMSPLALAASPLKASVKSTTGAAPAAAKPGFEFPLEPPAFTLPPAESKEKLLKQLRSLKIESRGLVRTFDQMHDWIALNIPTMSAEEDNGGVEIMGVVISNIMDMSTVIRQVYSLESKYLSDRIDIEASIARYPDCPSYERQLLVLDSNTWDDVEKGWRSIIRACLLIHSVLAKNMKVLYEPRADRDRGFVM